MENQTTQTPKTQTPQPDVLPTGAATEQTSSTPPTPPIPEPPKKNWALVIGIVVLVLATLGVGGYFTYQNYSVKKQAATSESSPTPTPDPTANWKIYTSKTKNFSFKIPEQFVIAEKKDGIEIFLDQKALDKSKICKPDPKEIEPLPCSPYLLNIIYAEASRSAYKSGEDYVNQVRGGIAGNPPYKTVQSQALTWTVGTTAGLELRPTIRAFTYDNDKIRFVETNTYIMPFWNYQHNTSRQFSDSELNTLIKETSYKDIENLTHQILSTFKFLGASDQKIFTVPEYPFSFEYPADWEVKGPTMGVWNGKTLYSYNLYFPSQYSQIVLGEGLRSDLKSPQDLNKYEQFKWQLLGTETVNILGTQATIINARALEGGYSPGDAWVVFEAKGKTFGIMISPYTEESRGVFNKVLSSFKFTR